MVPRRAVRKVGPRPDLTRSTHIGEPSDPTGLLGDGSRGLCLPYRGRTSPQVAVERRTKGASPRLRVTNVSEPPGALIEPSRGLRVSTPLPARAPEIRQLGAQLRSDPAAGRVQLIRVSAAGAGVLEGWCPLREPCGRAASAREWARGARSSSHKTRAAAGHAAI